MDHRPVFEELGEQQVRLQFSHRDGDVGREARAWLHEIEEAREKARHAELLAEIKKPHWSITPSFYLLVLSVLLTAVAVIVAVVALREQQSSASNQPPPKEQTSVVGNSTKSPP